MYKEFKMKNENFDFELSKNYQFLWKLLMRSTLEFCKKNTGHFWVILWIGCINNRQTIDKRRPKINLTQCMRYHDVIQELFRRKLQSK